MLQGAPELTVAWALASACRNLKALFRMSGGVPSPSQLMAISGGANNKVTLAEVASAGAEYQLSTDPNPATFNGGRALLQQVSYVRAPIQGRWGPGETRTFFMHNVYGNSCDKRIRCIVFRAGNTGVVCSGFENRGKGLIAIKLRNTAGYELPAWQTSHRFGVQLGP
jgi:hypothetical protein